LAFTSILLLQGIEFVIAKQQKNTDQPAQEAVHLIIIFTTNKNFNNMELIHAQPIVNSIIYSLLGIVILLIGYFIIEKLTPENTWKEVVEKNNVAVAIVLAAFIIGISMIISAAIHG
jgi:hypothetical protein